VELRLPIALAKGISFPVNLSLDLPLGMRPQSYRTMQYVIRNGTVSIISAVHPAECLPANHGEVN
jgi:hypothetical protein